MRHCEDYQVLISEEGIPVFLLPYSSQEPEKAILLYDGGKHATLFRNDQDVILVDFIPQETATALMTCGFCVILEETPDRSAVFRDYKATVKIVKDNALTDNL